MGARVSVSVCERGTHARVGEYLCASLAHGTRGSHYSIAVWLVAHELLPFLRFGRFFCKYKFKRLRRTVMPIHRYRLRLSLSNQEIHEVSPTAYEWFADRSAGSVAASFEDAWHA